MRHLSPHTPGFASSFSPELMPSIHTPSLRAMAPARERHDIQKWRRCRSDVLRDPETQGQALTAEYQRSAGSGPLILVLEAATSRVDTWRNRPSTGESTILQLVSRHSPLTSPGKLSGPEQNIATVGERFAVPYARTGKPNATPESDAYLFDVLLMGGRFALSSRNAKPGGSYRHITS